MKRRLGPAMAFAAAMLTAGSCSSSSSSSSGAPNSPAGTGGDHGGGRSGQHAAAAIAGTGGKGAPQPDAGARALPVVTCGSTTCSGSPMFSACCVDAATGTCGVENKFVGIACGVPAVANPSCPDVSVDFAGAAIMVQGCCTPSAVAAVSTCRFYRVALVPQSNPRTTPAPRRRRRARAISEPRGTINLNGFRGHRPFIRRVHCEWLYTAAARMSKYLFLITQTTRTGTPPAPPQHRS